MMLNKIDVSPFSVSNDIKMNKNDQFGNPIREEANPSRIILDIVIESASESTMHGIPHIFKRHHWFNRLFWIVCFLASAGVCSWMIAQTVIAYFSYDTVTKTQRVHSVSTEFPAVSICNINPYMTNVSYAFVQSVLIANGLVNPMAPTSAFRFYFDSFLKNLRFIVGMNAFMPTQTDSTRKSFSHSLEDMLLSCTYNMNGCTANDFEWYYDVFYGNCYKFNGGKYANGSDAPIRTSTRAGAINGLTVELFLYEPDNVLSLASATGAHVLVHNKTTMPLFFSGLMLATGQLVNVEVKRAFSSFMESPYSECTQNIDETYPSVLVKNLLKKGYSYNQQNCFLACYQSYVKQKCGCYNIVAYLISGTPDTLYNSTFFCTSSSSVFCDGEMFSEFFSLDVDAICKNDCPLECNDVIYNTYINTADYPAPIYANSLMQNPAIQAKYASNISRLTYDSLKRNMIEISVYYGDLGYEQYQEVASMDLIGTISNIGGTLGLFLGMSFLSFVEIIDIVIQILVYKLTPNSV